MNNIKFTVKNKSLKKRKWTLTKNVKVKVDNLDKNTIKKTRKKTIETINLLKKLSPFEKKDLLEKKNVIKSDSKAPVELLDIMLRNLV